VSPPTPSPPQPAAEDKSQLIKRLFAEIQVAAKAKDFTRAEELREKLIEIDPMALREIIKASEIIEEEKTAGADREHLAIWDNLYGDLSQEERNCVFYSMKKYLLPPKKMILAHGALNNRLFLIDKGRVTIFFPKDGKNIILAQLGRGDILGEYTFSTISLCSASAITHSEVQLRCLENAATDGWEDKCPGLYDKLIEFCLKHGRVDEIIRAKKLEKRTYSRFPAEGRVTAVVLTKEGEKSEAVFAGGLSDISVAGACFTFRCTKKATARALLARHLLLSISNERGDAPTVISAIGKVMRVSFHLYEDYSVHVRFNELLTEEQCRKFMYRQS
jgi:CRP-like cAMP-binding protein